LRRETGIQVQHKVLKWNGRPISETEVVDALREIAKKSSEKVVLTAGM
jgi:2-oxoglutarate ferredoxin oxidoreductase subunit alpha